MIATIKKKKASIPYYASVVPFVKKKKKGHFGSFTMNGSGSKFDIKLIK